MKSRIRFIGHRAVAATAMVLLLSGCSGKPEKKTPEPVKEPSSGPKPLAVSGIKPVIKPTGNMIRNVFIEDRNITQFDIPHHIYKAMVSPNQKYLMVWHMSRPPRKISTYDLSGNRKITTFSPGFGGRLTWGDHNLIYHRHGAGTNVAVLAVYSVDGNTEWRRQSTGASLCDSGKYVFSFPTTGLADERIEILDIRTGKTLASARPGGIACVTGHEWLDEKTVRFSYSQIGGAVKTVDISIAPE